MIFIQNIKIFFLAILLFIQNFCKNHGFDQENLIETPNFLRLRKEESSLMDSDLFLIPFKKTNAIHNLGIYLFYYSTE